MGPRFRVSSERLEKRGIEPTTPGLEGEQLNHYATEASVTSFNKVTKYDCMAPSVASALFTPFNLHISVHFMNYC